MNIVINIGQRGAGGVVSARRRRSERAERAVVSAESNVHCIRVLDAVSRSGYPSPLRSTISVVPSAAAIEEAVGDWNDAFPAVVASPSLKPNERALPPVCIERPQRVLSKIAAPLNVVEVRMRLASLTNAFASCCYAARW